MAIKCILNIIGLLSLLLLPLTVTAFEDEEIFTIRSTDKTKVDPRDQFCTNDQCHEIKNRFTDTKRTQDKAEMEIYNSLTPDEKLIFSTTDDDALSAKGKPSIKTEAGTLTPKTDEGADNIIKNYPQYKDVIENKIKPLMIPGTYDSLKLVWGCCPEFQFFSIDKTLKNLQGKEKKIVHFERLRKYQLTFQGLCAEDGGTYSDNGHCRQGDVKTMYLVHETKTPKFSFDLFWIRGFCKCHNY